MKKCQKSNIFKRVEKRHLSKKAQIAGQMFVYILGFVIFALVLLYGYNAIKNLGEKAEQTSYIQFKTEFTQSIKKLSTDYGTVRRKEFTVPRGFTSVCFVDSDRIGVGITMSDYPLIKDSVQSGVQDNLFLIGQGVQDSFDAGKLEIGIIDPENGLDDQVCVRVLNGKLKVKLTGLGNRVRVEDDTI